MRSEHFRSTSRHVSSLGSGRSSPHLVRGTSRSPYTLQLGSSASTPDAHSPSPLPDITGESQPDDEAGEDFSTFRGEGKRRRDSDREEDSSRKSQNTRKTAVACNFCRGEVVFVFSDPSLMPFTQVASFGVTALNHHAKIVPCASFSASTFLFRGVGDQERPQKERNRKKVQTPGVVCRLRPRYRRLIIHHYKVLFRRHALRSIYQ